MNKIKKYILISSILSYILYLGLALWLYFQDKSDTTGWGSIGVIAFSVIFVFPAIALIGGISGQIITGKIWLFAVINSIGSALFITSVIIFMDDIKYQIFILIPVVFVVTLIISAITLGVSKLFGNKNNKDIIK